MSVFLIPLCKYLRNFIVYEKMSLGEEEPLLVFYIRVLHDPSPGITRKMKYLGMGIRRTGEKVQGKQFRLNDLSEFL